MLPSMLRKSLVVVAIASSLACDGSTEPEVPVPGPPTRIERIVDPTTAVAGTVIPVVVRVTDENRRPVPNVGVRWIAADGSGVTGVPPHTTDAEGKAKADWWLGTDAKRYTMSAHVMVGEGATQTTVAVTTFSLVATSPPAN